MGGSEAPGFQVVVRQHFQANEYQQERKTHFEVMELVQDIHQEEKHGTQSQNGKYVGEENDVRIAGDRENGGYGIHGKDHVGELDNQQDQEQRGDQPFAIHADEEFISLVLRIDGEVAGRQLHDLVVFRIYFLFLVAVYKHHVASVHQEYTENV